MGLKIRIVFVDVDGVLTDGTKSYHENGSVSKIFHDQDSAGLKLLLGTGVEICIISADDRVNELWSKHQNLPFIESNDKSKTITEYLSEKNYSNEQAAFIGDELRDLQAMKIVKYSFAPTNAVKEVVKIAWKVLKRKGGDGAVREAVDLIMKINSI